MMDADAENRSPPNRVKVHRSLRFAFKPNGERERRCLVKLQLQDDRAIATFNRNNGQPKIVKTCPDEFVAALNSDDALTFCRANIGAVFKSGASPKAPSRPPPPVPKPTRAPPSRPLANISFSSQPGCVTSAQEEEFYDAAETHCDALRPVEEAVFPPAPASAPLQAAEVNKNAPQETEQGESWAKQCFSIRRELEATRLQLKCAEQSWAEALAELAELREAAEARGEDAPTSAEPQPSREELNSLIAAAVDEERAKWENKLVGVETSLSEINAQQGEELEAARQAATSAAAEANEVMSQCEAIAIEKEAELQVAQARAEECEKRMERSIVTTKALQASLHDETVQREEALAEATRFKAELNEVRLEVLRASYDAQKKYAKEVRDSATSQFEGLKAETIKAVDAKKVADAELSRIREALTVSEEASKAAEANAKAEAEMSAQLREQVLQSKDLESRLQSAAEELELVRTELSSANDRLGKCEETIEAVSTERDGAVKSAERQIAQTERGAKEKLDRYKIQLFEMQEALNDKTKENEELQQYVLELMGEDSGS